MNIIVFISGTGSNLKAIIDYLQTNNNHNLNITAVISDNSNAKGLELARKNNINTYVIPVQKSNNKNYIDIYSKNLLEVVQRLNPDLIILAGFMKILSKEFISHYPNKILNIHPSLLPKYPGLHTHQRALDNKDQEHGCTIHIVTEQLDCGPILAQDKCKIEDSDTEDTLKHKVQQIEHKLYIKTIIEYSKNLVKDISLT